MRWVALGVALAGLGLVARAAPMPDIALYDAYEELAQVRCLPPNVIDQTTGACECPPGISCTQPACPPPKLMDPAEPCACPPDEARASPTGPCVGRR